MYQLYRKDELKRLRRKIDEIRSRKPELSHDKTSQGINLPMISLNTHVRKQRLIDEENSKLKIRIDDVKRNKNSQYSYRQIRK